MNYYKKITTSPRSVQGKNLPPFVWKGTIGKRSHNSVVQTGWRTKRALSIIKNIESLYSGGDLDVMELNSDISGFKNQFDGLMNFEN